MFRTPDEMAFWVHDRAEGLERAARDHRRTTAAIGARSPRPVAALRRAVGFGLIGVGQRLAGDTAAAGRGAGRPAATGNAT